MHVVKQQKRPMRWRLAREEKKENKVSEHKKKKKRCNGEKGGYH
jgi:hypothetical protein